MAGGHRRPRVVFDTNVFIAAYLSSNPASPNRRVLQVWRDRRVQLVVSDQIEAEYLGVLARFGASRTHIDAFAQRLAKRRTVLRVRPPRAVRLSRDPADNAFLAAAVAGKARFVVTNDRDLLQVPVEQLRPFRLAIVTPNDLLLALTDLARLANKR